MRKEEAGHLSTLSTPQKGAPKAEPQRLARGVLSTFDIAAATLANIAPAMSFFFSFAFLVSTAGIAAPLTIVAAAIVIGLLGNTLTQFVRIHPSTGSFVTFVGKGFGGYAAVVSAVVLGVGYTIAISSVVAISGGWTETVLKHYLSITIPWQLLALLLSCGAGYMVIRGAKPSTKVAAAFFVFELALLVVIAIAVLIQHHSHINLQPFNPSKLHNGFSGLALGFPLAIYMFVGWENSAAMAEESANPRQAVPKAVFAAIGLITVVYLLLSYSTVIGFDGNAKNLTAESVPFITAAHGVASLLAFLAYLAALTSILSSLISAVNSQARIIFNSGREGLFPSVFGKVTEQSRTPWVAFVAFIGVGLGLTYVFAWNSSDTAIVNFFAEISTLGTILIILVYLLTNLALPVYMWRKHRGEFKPVTHAVLPLIGSALICYVLYELVKPDQAKPLSEYPLIAGAIVVFAIVYGAFVYRRDPSLGDRVGSIVADAE